LFLISVVIATVIEDKSAAAAYRCPYIES